MLNRNQKKEVKMINETPIIYIALGTHPSDSKRFFTVGTTTLKGHICREHIKNMEIKWSESLPTIKSKRGWDKWDTDHMGPWVDNFYQRTRVMYDATMMKELGCHTSRTDSWWIAPKSAIQQLDTIVEVVRERLYMEVNK